MEGIELISFGIISKVGIARSCFVEAMRYAQANDFVSAENSIEEGINQLREGHKIHAELIQREANNEKIELCLLLLHAEDTMMSAEVLEITAKEIITLHKKMQPK